MENTIENNKLIAEFMGVETIENFYFNLPQFPETRGFNSSTRYIKEELKYDTSWDWLMPVVEKIENIFVMGDYAVSVIFEQENKCIITVLFQPKSENDRYKTKQFSENRKTKIESVYKAVVEFIKWFNEKNK